MCLKYPGVRCKQSYKSAHSKAVENTAKAFTELSDAKRNTPEKLGLTQKQYDSKIEKGTQNLFKQREKLETIKAKMDATKDGIAEIKEQLNDEELTRNDYHELSDRLQKASNNYHSQLLAYDRYNNTVYGKKPSTKIGTIDKVNSAKQTHIAREKLKEAHSTLTDPSKSPDEFEENRQKFIKARSDFERLKSKNQHIQNTSEYVDMGYIKDPRTAADWDREANYWLEEAKKLEKDEKPRSAKKFEAEGIRCLKSKTVADSNYSMAVPSIVKENGETAKLFLYHEGSNNSWSWTDGTGKHYPAQDSYSGNMIVPQDIPGLENAKVESKPMPVEYKLFTRPNGDAYSVLVPNQARCVENPELIGQGEK